MARLMSVALTERAVVERRKRVTRRLGWWEDKRGRRLLKPGDPLTLVRKAMGRKPGEPLVRLAEVEVVDVRRERLNAIGVGETALEGFPDFTAGAFVVFFCQHMRCKPDTEVTRIEWRYLEVCQMCQGEHLVHGGMGATACPACDVDCRPVPGWEDYYFGRKAA